MYNGTQYGNGKIQKTAPGFNVSADQVNDKKYANKRYLGDAFSTTDKIDTSQGLTVTFTTKIPSENLVNFASIVNNVLVEVQADESTTTKNVKATVGESNTNKANLGGIMAGAAIKGAYNSNAFSESASQVTSQSISESVSESASESESIEKSKSASTSKSIVDSNSDRKSKSIEESSANSASNSESQSKRDSVSVSISSSK